MPSWPVVIVFAVLASCAVVVIAGYFRGNRKIREGSADPGGSVPPRQDEPPTESWIWG
jgi:hypothetical protein